MYLQNIVKENPLLIEKTIQFHQKGLIPPNTWVIDLDTIAANAEVLSATAKNNNLTVYLMSKQHNRNPYVNGIAIAKGLNKIVAVDVQGALQCGRYNIPLGHVGHLEQIPHHFIPKIIKLRPEVITVYSIEQAKWINEAAIKENILQKILIRVSTQNDIFFDGQEGGFDESELEKVVFELKKLNNIRLVGVTSFPCVNYNESADEQIKITNNMYTIVRVAASLRKMGFSIEQINAPGNTSTNVMHLLKNHGATHVEPGNALIGTTPSNAFRNNLPEKTAFIYLTEISHFFRNRAYAYGGGVYHNAYSNLITALIGSTWEEAENNEVEYLDKIKQDIDYHMQFVPKTGQNCKIGDSVILAYRTQMQMTRSYILPISGLSGKRELKLHYLFDHANNALDKNLYPVSPEIVCIDIEKLIKTY